MNRIVGRAGPVDDDRAAENVSQGTWDTAVKNANLQFFGVNFLTCELSNHKCHGRFSTGLSIRLGPRRLCAQSIWILSWVPYCILQLANKFGWISSSLRTSKM